MTSCPDCRGRDARCATCDGAPLTEPCPPPREAVTTLDALEWPDEEPTAEQCPIAMRKHHAG